MNIDVQRWIDRIIGSLICRMLSWLPGARRTPPSDGEPQRILVILLSEMGSLVLARPMFERLKERYPAASLYALVFEQNREVLDLIGLVQGKHVLTVRNSSLPHLLQDSVIAILAMRRNGIDTVIDCELFSRISSIFSYLSGAALRVGFHRHTQEGLYRGSFINRPVLYNPYLHISRQFLNLAESLEAEGFPLVKRQVNETLSLPELQLCEHEVPAMSRRLSRDFPQISGKRLIFVYPGGGLLPIRAWPQDFFAELVDGLAARGYAVGIIGMKRDKEIAEKILTRCGHSDCVDLTGYTATVRELMALFHLAALLITNDGGPGHFAAMTPIPSIIFYGPETPQLYGPLGSKAEVFYAGLSCSPCVTAYNHRKSPCDGNNVCLKAFLPETVLCKALKSLERTPG
jgi:lipopolysaccharide heptosyltransferase II